MKYDVVVVGGGAAGIAAAIKSSELGLRTALVDCRERLGGILPQCIHSGFGIHYFGEELTGCEFAYRLITNLEKSDVDVYLDAFVKGVRGNILKIIEVVSEGRLRLESKAVILAVGAREKTAFEIGIGGDRVAGIYTAGECQAMMDIYGILPGKKVIIVGSGDVGLIMARRFAIEGCEVVGIVEIRDFPGGTYRNLVQCVYDFDIPILFRHRVVSAKGYKRVEKVLIENLESGERFWKECDLLVIAAGLVPNNDLMIEIGAVIDEATLGPVVDEYFQTSVDGVFAVGNCVIINELVDYAVEQGIKAAIGTNLYINGSYPKSPKRILKGNYIHSFVPQLVNGTESFIIYGRVNRTLKNATIRIGKLSYYFSVLRPSEMFRINIREPVVTDVLLEAYE